MTLYVICSQYLRVHLSTTSSSKKPRFSSEALTFPGIYYPPQKALPLFHFVDLGTFPVFPVNRKQRGGHSEMKLLTKCYDVFKNNTAYIMLDVKKNMLEVIRENAFRYYNR